VRQRIARRLTGTAVVGQGCGTVVLDDAGGVVVGAGDREPPVVTVGAGPGDVIV